MQIQLKYQFPRKNNYEKTIPDGIIFYGVIGKFSQSDEEKHFPRERCKYYFLNKRCPEGCM
jgi:hypothetical protein